jgi:hypothetical protein
MHIYGGVLHKEGMHQHAVRMILSAGCEFLVYPVAVLT